MGPSIQSGFIINPAPTVPSDIDVPVDLPVFQPTVAEKAVIRSSAESVPGICDEVVPDNDTAKAQVESAPVPQNSTLPMETKSWTMSFTPSQPPPQLDSMPADQTEQDPPMKETSSLLPNVSSQQAEPAAPGVGYTESPVMGERLPQPGVMSMDTEEAGLEHNPSVARQNMTPPTESPDQGSYQGSYRQQDPATYLQDSSAPGFCVPPVDQDSQATEVPPEQPSFSGTHGFPDNNTPLSTAAGVSSGVDPSPVGQPPVLTPGEHGHQTTTKVVSSQQGPEEATVIEMEANQTYYRQAAEHEAVPGHYQQEGQFSQFSSESYEQPEQVSHHGIMQVSHTSTPGNQTGEDEVVVIEMEDTDYTNTQQ